MSSPLLEDVTLPPGWHRKVTKRENGASSGRIEVFIYGPNRKRFRSRNELKKFFDKRGETSLKPDDFDFSIYGRNNSKRLRTTKNYQKTNRNVSEKPYSCNTKAQSSSCFQSFIDGSKTNKKDNTLDPLIKEEVIDKDALLISKSNEDLKYKLKEELMINCDIIHQTKEEVVDNDLQSIEMEVWKPNSIPMGLENVSSANINHKKIYVEDFKFEVESDKNSGIIYKNCVDMNVQSSKNLFCEEINKTNIRMEQATSNSLVKIIKIDFNAEDTNVDIDQVRNDEVENVNVNTVNHEFQALENLSVDEALAFFSS